MYLIKSSVRHKKIFCTHFNSNKRPIFPFVNTCGLIYSQLTDRTCSFLKIPPRPCPAPSPPYRPALVMIISVPISWNRFHRSEPCRSTRVSDAAHTAAGCGLSRSASSLSAAAGGEAMGTLKQKHTHTHTFEAYSPPTL